VTVSGSRCIPGRWNERWPGRRKPKKGAPDDLIDGQAGDIDRYEQLRLRVLSGEPSGWRLGLGVLAGRGVAGWLRVFHTAVPAPERSSVHDGSVGSVHEGPVGSDQVVGVLASMALACVEARR
jgi:hypothetical protein